MFRHRQCSTTSSGGGSFASPFLARAPSSVPEHPSSMHSKLSRRARPSSRQRRWPGSGYPPLAGVCAATVWRCHTYAYDLLAL